MHVIAPGGTPFDAPKRVGSLTIHRAGGGALFTWPGALARLKEMPLRALWVAPFAVGVRSRLARIGPVDEIVAHWIVPCAWPLCLGTRTRLTAVAHGADVRFLLELKPFVRGPVVRSLVERGTTFIFAAERPRESLLASLDHDLAERLRAQSHVHPPEVDMPDVAPQAATLRASMSLVSGQLLAVVCGRLIPSKRVDLAIEAAADPRIRLVVVGDGPERARLEALAQTVAPHTRFVGALPRREALAWIGAADVLVFPSAVEAAPTAVREARLLGVPVLACDAGDIAAWAEDDTQIRVLPGEATAFAEALAQIPARAG